MSQTQGASGALVIRVPPGLAGSNARATFFDACFLEHRIVQSAGGAYGARERRAPSVGCEVWALLGDRGTGGGSGTRRPAGMGGVSETLEESDPGLRCGVGFFLMSGLHCLLKGVS
ncbi:hypothetical protein PCAR4_830024 [Paraburkholderia caribensis]|nr:hypothetical protein PCAR4_830024 [Paraburkholderia caribensis]